MKSQEQCNLYKNIINNINDAILVVDYLGNITFVNKSAINLYRYSFDEFLNMTISQLMHSSKFLESQFKDNYTDMINYKKDNSSFFAVIKYFKMQDYIIFYIRERTKRELKEKENKNLASIVESSDDAILAKDINGIIYSWNTGAEKIYGYKRKEILGKHISIVIPEESDDSIDVILDKIKRGEK
ncbi:PAS domain-containing protein [Clostridium pasteurianum]|nr:PAS domain S-box protein [Clostridium pasteurianum]